MVFGYGAFGAHLKNYTPVLAGVLISCLFTQYTPTTPGILIASIFCLFVMGFIFLCLHNTWDTFMLNLGQYFR